MTRLLSLLHKHIYYKRVFTVNQESVQCLAIVHEGETTTEDRFYTDRFQYLEFIIPFFSKYTRWINSDDLSQIQVWLNTINLSWGQIEYGKK